MDILDLGIQLSDVVLLFLLLDYWGVLFTLTSIQRQSDRCQKVGNYSITTR